MENHIRKLADQQLLNETKIALTTERDAIARQLILFGEIFRRRLYAREGYESLFTYLMKAHGFSRATAYQRAVIAKAGLRWQELLRLIGGRLISLEGAALVANALLRGGDESLLEKVSCLTNEQIEILIMGEKSLPKARDSIRTIGVIDLSSGAETSSYAAGFEFSAQGQATESPEKAGKSTEVEATPLPGSTDMVPSPLVSSREVDAKSVVVKISFATNRSVANKLQRVKDLLARKVPDGRLSDVLDHLLDSFIEHHDPAQGKATKRKASTPTRPNKMTDENSSEDTRPSTARRDPHFEKMKVDLIRTAESSGPELEKPIAVPHSRYIPVAIKRDVSRRDGMRCTYIAADGRRCEAVRYLEFDHDQPFALGGRSDDLDNIFLKCAAHNRLRSQDTFDLR